MKKSKFFDMVNKSKDIKIDNIPAGPAIPQAELDALIGAVTEESIPDVVISEVPKELEVLKEEQVSVITSEPKRAYNIWYDTTNRTYILDVIEYEGSNVISIQSSNLSNSQALAMAKVKEIYTEKLIIKRGKY